jgi:hypothetical protein
MTTLTLTEVEATLLRHPLSDHLDLVRTYPPDRPGADELRADLPLTGALLARLDQSVSEDSRPSAAARR